MKLPCKPSQCPASVMVIINTIIIPIIVFERWSSLETDLLNILLYTQLPWLKNLSNQDVFIGFNHSARLNSRTPVGFKTTHYWLNNMFEEKIASSDQHLIHRHNSAAETPLSHPLLLIWCYYLMYIVSPSVLVAFTFIYIVHKPSPPQPAIIKKQGEQQVLAAVVRHWHSELAPCDQTFILLVKQ